ncbi:MAG: hydrogenase maturation nickel metallochaperone HypA [Desulfofustis sp.]|jgi:hydrogenase nickel insertion protein HypA|nr:hydrogenase maturation nickel metallochaperone HypA [Desulfofustis sp.]
MHEISLVQGLLQQLHDLAAEHRTARVTKVTMVVGPLSGVVVESFQFGFDILTREDDLVRGAELEIVIPEVSYRCSGCGAVEKTAGQRPRKCSGCGDPILIAEQGMGGDVILQQVEMED